MRAVSIECLRLPVSSVPFLCVKFLFPLILLASPLHAKLLATFHTTRGNVVVELQYDKTPQTVANFITLAQATRTRVDPLTGAVIRKPLYVGEKFFRVVNDPGFKIAQTGSGTGVNSGGPGYTFRDEFHTELKHDPYVLAMANSGDVHDNGSQIYLTGGVSIPGLDNKHTVFGLITDSASRGAIDAIMAAGSNGTTINNVTFERTDAAAQAFDEHAQKLPICSGIEGNLDVTPGLETLYQFADSQPGGSAFQAYRSGNLQSWDKLGEIYQVAGEDVSRPIKLDSATLSRAFYNISLASYPDALVQATLANRTLNIVVNGTRTLNFVFDATGTSGTFTDSNAPAVTGIITGASSALEEPYKVRWFIDVGPDDSFAFNMILSKETPSGIEGTHESYEWNGSAYGFIGTGGLTLAMQ
jgi:peptidyl-prolyl cis-trans isomerase A (cyclophilin A)